MRGARLLGLIGLVGCVGYNGSYSFGGFECQEFTCLWQVDQGALAETHTWHKDALAYRLEGMPARITREANVSGAPPCLEAEMVAYVAKDALGELQWDFDNDRNVDARSPLVPGQWQRHSYYVRAPSVVRHLRVYFAKLGAGELALDELSLRDGEDNCADLPATTLANGSACLDDASCSSGYCVIGKCSACGAGGCAEGSACRADKDCLGGACAAGVCRACALDGSCGKGEGCTQAAQCASRSCNFGGQPSLVRYPELDGVCGECNADASCPSGHCVLGQCVSCASDADCTGGLRCRYTSTLEAGGRACLPLFEALLPRGALCEVDAECSDGLRCGASPGRAKRCGFACAASAECQAGEACGSPGTIPGAQAGAYELLPAFGATPNARVSTCYPPYDPRKSREAPCQVHAQCTNAATEYSLGYPHAVTSCCGGYCTQTSAVDPVSGLCDVYSGPFVEFLYPH